MIFFILHSLKLYAIYIIAYLEKNFESYEEKNRFPQSTAERIILMTNKIVVYYNIFVVVVEVKLFSGCTEAFTYIHANTYFQQLRKL